MDLKNIQQRRKYRSIWQKVDHVLQTFDKECATKIDPVEISRVGFLPNQNVIFKFQGNSPSRIVIQADDIWDALEIATIVKGHNTLPEFN